MSSPASNWWVRTAVIVVAVGLIGGTAALTVAGDRHRSPVLAAALGHPPVPATSDPTSGTHGATGSQASAPRSGRVFVVGDSLTVGTEPWLRGDLQRRGWHLTGVDARIGRPVAEGLAVLRADRKDLPGTVVVALGTNDLGASPQLVATWLRTARAIVGPRRLVWVNLCLADNVGSRLAAYRATNAALRKEAPRYGIEVADWCTYASARGITPGPDGIHYDSAGYEKRAGFYARSVAATTPAGRAAGG